MPEMCKHVSTCDPTCEKYENFHILHILLLGFKHLGPPKLKKSEEGPNGKGLDIFLIFHHFLHVFYIFPGIMSPCRSRRPKPNP